MHQNSQSAGEVTSLLKRNDLSDSDKNDQLLMLIYSELKSLANYKMSSERANHTLTPTALVHEAYLRLVKEPDLKWQSKNHFFAAAAESMRRILIESARHKLTQKKGANAKHTNNIEQLDGLGNEFETNIIDLDRALTQLEKIDENMSSVVKLRYFSGLTVDETASALELSPRTVNRLWTAARAWLIAHM
jgi:RNA polymerase sigma factor (TIGR02999 family)